MVDWLVCAASCIPGRAHMGLNLMVVTEPSGAIFRIRLSTVNGNVELRKR